MLDTFNKNAYMTPILANVLRFSKQSCGFHDTFVIFEKKYAKRMGGLHFFSNKGSNFEDPYHTLFRDLAKTHGFLKVTCRNCDRGARKWCDLGPAGGVPTHPLTRGRGSET